MKAIQRPTIAEINLDAVANNYLQFTKLVQPASVMPVIKANAYGCGLIACAKVLEQLSAPYLAVAFLEEAITIRNAGINTPILVLGGLLGSQIKHYLEHNLDITASSVSKLQAINEVANKLKTKARVHLKIDTGFERIGTHYYTADTLLKTALESKCCEITGIYSHFAAVKQNNLDYSRLQLERFLEVCSFFDKHSLVTPIKHIAATSACLTFEESYLDMVRPGLGLYGVTPNEINRQNLQLTPVMQLKSKVVYFKVVKKYAAVSYDLTWQAPEDTRVVTIPIGYGDGYLRSLSNKASCIIREKTYPIVGNVCMDQLMVDIGPDGTAYNGDIVTMIGKQGEAEITIEQLAKLANTTPHEIMVLINSRVPRHYIYKGRHVDDSLQPL